MSNSDTWSLVIGALVLSAGINRFLVWYLRRRNVLDIPNERSSHKIPTPRGGGIGIVIAVALMGAIYSLIKEDYHFALVLGVSLTIGIVGWIDDVRRGLSTGLRFMIQIACAIALMLVLGPIDQLPFPAPLDISLGWFGYVIGVIWMISVTNYFNFLDGIDGYAGTQGLIAGGALAALCWGTPLGIFGLFIAGACLGFLFFNWHPAKIFMGDVGSSFLGYLFAAIPFYEQQPDKRNLMFFATALFLWFFLADAAFTMIRRALKGEKVWQAHRSHLYQRLVISGMKHSQVVMMVLALYVPIYGWFFISRLQGFEALNLDDKERYVSPDSLLLRSEQPLAVADWSLFGLGLLLFGVFFLITRSREKKREMETITKPQEELVKSEA